VFEQHYSQTGREARLDSGRSSWAAESLEADSQCDRIVARSQKLGTPDPAFLAQVRAEDFADETKGSPTSGFERARHTLSRTFRMGPMIWQMLSGAKIACIRMATTADVGTDS
jgi:hypothetical protein